MKRMNLILASLIIFGLMTGCGGNKSQNAQDGNGSDNSSQSITMTLKVNGKVSISIGGEKTASIDWGDNSPVQSVMLNQLQDYGVGYEHVYTRTAEYILKITGENITVLVCNDMGMTKLNLDVPTLKTLCCGNNQLTNLDLSKNNALTNLYCGRNPLTGLDLSNNSALVSLKCDQNQLKSLDLSQNTKLESLICSNNQLKSLDLSKNIELKDVNCGDNPLTSLDVSKNTKLEYIGCYSTQLTNLDLSKNIALKEFSCEDCKLTSLDVSKNNKIRLLNCINNQLSANAFNALFNSLHKNSELNCHMYIANNPGTDACDHNIAKKKGWSVEGNVVGDEPYYEEDEEDGEVG